MRTRNSIIGEKTDCMVPECMWTKTKASPWPSPDFLGSECRSRAWGKDRKGECQAFLSSRAGIYSLGLHELPRLQLSFIVFLRIHVCGVADRKGLLDGAVPPGGRTRRPPPPRSSHAPSPVVPDLHDLEHARPGVLEARLVERAFPAGRQRPRRR